MQEAGIPITYAYVSDAHDAHGISGSIHAAYGPGEVGYTQQLQAYDQAFQKFFDRLAADGINKRNTLFVFTVDEGDHSRERYSRSPRGAMRSPPRSRSNSMAPNLRANPSIR
jgi:hypothetical protein